MNKKDLEKLKEQLLLTKQRIINGGLLKSNEDLTVASEDLPDEADLATNVIHQQVSFNLRNRELAKLRLVEAALQRIEDGTYGCCLDCDEEIHLTRLKNQPWAAFCIIHAEEREREGSRFQFS